MEVSVAGRSVPVVLAEFNRKINYLLSRTDKDIDLDYLQAQIDEILQKLEDLQIDKITELIDNLEARVVIVEQDVSVVKIQLKNVTTQVDQNTQDIKDILDKLNNLPGCELPDGATAILKWILAHKDELLNIYKLYKELIELGVSREILAFYIKNYDKFVTILETFESIEPYIEEFKRQISFMKELMLVTKISNTYYDIINHTDPVIPPKIIGYVTNELSETYKQYNKLPSIDTELSDLRYPDIAVIMIEINRNTVINSNDGVLFSQSFANTGIKITESNDELTYQITTLLETYSFTIQNFQITGTDQFTSLPNYGYHFLILQKTDSLKKTYSLSVITGIMDVNTETITVTDKVVASEVEASVYISLTTKLPFQTTFFTSYNDTTFGAEYDIFKKMYISAVLENIAYKTDEILETQYTNQIANNLYGQSTAIAVSKIMSKLGNVPILKEVEYTLKESDENVRTSAYIEEVTSWRSSQYTTRTNNITIDPVVQSNKVWGVAQTNAAFNTLLEQNQRFWANTSKSSYINSRQYFSLKQSYEDEQRIVQGWLEEEFENITHVSAVDDSSRLFNSNYTLTSTNVTKDMVSVAIGNVHNADYGPAPYVMRVYGLSNDVSAGFAGMTKKVTVRCIKNVVMYIRADNLSTDSSGSITGEVKIDGKTHSVKLDQYIYDNMNGTVSRVYRGVVITMPEANRTMYCNAMYPVVEETTKNTWVQIGINPYAVVKQQAPTYMFPNYDDRIEGSTVGIWAKLDSSSLSSMYMPGGMLDVPASNVIDSYVPYDIISSIPSRPINKINSTNTYTKSVVGWYPRSGWVQVSESQGEFNVESSFYYPSSSTQIVSMDYRSNRFDNTKNIWYEEQRGYDMYAFGGNLIITPPEVYTYTEIITYNITNLILKGNELTIPTNFDQIAIPDYILKLKNDIEYLNAYAEYLTVLIADLDRRVTLVEETLEDVIQTINDIIIAITPKSRSLGGQIMSFCGTAIGMFFPLTGLAISIVAQVYEGTVQLKRGNIVTGVMDIVTGSLMSVLGIRKFNQRMQRKYGGTNITKNDGLPSYDDLFGPPGYGSDNVRQDLYIGRKRSTPKVKTGTLRNTMILEETSTSLKMETWLYRTELGYQSEARSTTDVSTRAIRIIEAWENKKNTLLEYNYSEVSYADGNQTITKLTEINFQNDFNTTLTIDQFSKLLFAKTNKSVEDADGFGYDNEVFQIYMLTMANSGRLNTELSRNHRIKNKFKMVDSTLVPFRKRALTSDYYQRGLSIDDVYIALDSELCNNEAQQLILDSIYQMVVGNLP